MRYRLFRRSFWFTLLLLLTCLIILQLLMPSLSILCIGDTKIEYNDGNVLEVKGHNYSCLQRKHKMFPLKTLFTAESLVWSELKDRHAGESCLYVGNGPSLNMMNFSFIENFDVVFGVNKIFLGLKRFGWTPSYYASANKKVVEQSVEEILAMDRCIVKFLPMSLRKLFPQDAVVRHNIVFVKFSNTDRELGPLCAYSPLVFCYDISNGIHEGSTITYASLQILHYMGCEKVFIIGVDHSFVQSGVPNSPQHMDSVDPNHFDPSYFAGHDWDLADLRGAEAHFLMARSVFATSGRHILDATLGGKLQVFEKVSIEVLYHPDDLSFSDNIDAPIVIVVPFSPEQASRIRWHLVKAWSQEAFEVCTASSPNRPRNIDLVFYSSRPYKAWREEDVVGGTRHTIRMGLFYRLGYPSSSEKDAGSAVGACFRTINFLSPDDNTLIEVNDKLSLPPSSDIDPIHRRLSELNMAMAFALSDDRLAYSPYIFMLPSYVVPMQPDWLHGLQEFSLTLPERKEWVLGATPSCHNTHPMHTCSVDDATGDWSIDDVFDNDFTVKKYSSCLKGAVAATAFYRVSDPQFRAVALRTYSQSERVRLGDIPFNVALTLPKGGSIEQLGFHNMIVRNTPIVLHLGIDGRCTYSFSRAIEERESALFIVGCQRNMPDHPICSVGLGSKKITDSLKGNACCHMLIEG